VTLDIKNFFDSPFNFVLSVEVLMRPTLNTYQFTFSFEVELPIVAGLALDVLGNRKVQLFRHTNSGGFLLCP
jgi:hypothetical protein